MWSEVEKKSIQGIIDKQNVINWKTFDDAYEDRKQSDVGVLEDISNCEEKIQVVKTDKKLWYLQSRYNAAKAAADLAKQFENINNPNAVMIIFGLGNGEHIFKLIEKNKNCNVIIYEPCEQIFWNAIKYPLVAELLCLPNVYICVQGICDNLLQICFETFINYANYKMVLYCALPNYDVIFPDEYSIMQQKYLYEIKRIIFNRNTEILFSKEIIRNTLKLTKDVIEQYSIVQLENIVENKGLDNMPAILVAAGPSLDKNIDKLIELKTRAFIMVVDTALNTVLKHGIIPDMTITIDGHKPLILFENEQVKKIPIAVSIQSNEKVIDKSEAMRFYELSPDEFIAEAYRRKNKRVEGLPTGGSVANNALSLLVLMGFQTIIFMGLDLAYPEGKKHTFDAYHKEDGLTNGRKYFEIEDIYGNMVLTEANMQLYLKWFEAFIAVNKSIRFIDATEGGALIHGTEIMTIDQVVYKLLDKEYDKNKIWEDLSPYLTKAEQDEIKEMLISMPEQLEEAKAQMKRGIRLYEDLEKINRKSDGKSKTITRMLEQASELNEYMNNEMIFGLLKYYAIEEDYEVKGKILQYDESAAMYEQIEEIAENGLQILKGYMKGIDELKKDFPIMLDGIKDN